MQMNGMSELITAAKYWPEWGDPRLIVAVLNNQDLNQVTWEMRAMSGAPQFLPSQSLPDVPYADFARSIGLDGVRVEKPGEVEAAWHRALGADRPFVIDFRTDPAVPPIPPPASLEQIEAAATAILKGDSDKAGMVRQGFKAKVQEMLPGHRLTARTADDGSPVVEDVEAAAYTVPTDAPGGDGTLSWDSTTLVVVRARCGATTGLGYTYGSPTPAQVVAKQLADVVRGRSVWNVTATNEAMNRAVRNAGRPGLVAGAISAIDLALWDLKAHLLELPLVALLGASRTELPVYGSGGFTTYDEGQQDRQLRSWTEEQCIPRVKIKIDEGWGTAEDRDRERVVQARRSIGDRTELYVDANGAHNGEQAVRLARYLEDQGVTWFEEPASSDDLAGLARIRSAVTMDVAAGEYGYTLPYFRHMLDAGAVDCLQADVARCGGITVWRRTAALAEVAGIQISGHCAPHAHAHVAASVPNLRHLEWFHDHVRIERLLFDGAQDPDSGHIRPAADGAPGHGLTLRHRDAEPYCVA